MDSDYEKRVLSVLRGAEGWDEEFTSISEFKHHLGEEEEIAGLGLTQEKLQNGWALWREIEMETKLVQEKILTLLKHIASSCWSHYILQFWAVVMRVERHHHHHHRLSTSYHPFCVGPDLKKGHSWYRKLCRDHVYVVDVDGDVQDQQLQLGLGGVGRAYHSKQPESSPDLRLYSTKEFPMRDEAARCGFRAYLALPLFDSHTDQCYGVLELLSHHPIMTRNLLSTLNRELQAAELRSTHTPIYTRKMHQHARGIREILELVMCTVPRLYLAQVWIPCKQKQCVNMINTNICCIQVECFMNHQMLIISKPKDIHGAMFYYLRASKFHNLKIDFTCSESNLCDVSITKNPLAHYAQRARVSHCVAIPLKSVEVSNDMYIIQFVFLPKPKFREDDAYGDYSVHLLLRTLQRSLKTFKFLSGGNLLEEFLVRSREPNAVASGSIDSSKTMKFYKKHLSECNFTTYLETVDSCSLQPSSQNKGEGGWVFCSPFSEILWGNDVNTLLVIVRIREKIEKFMKSIAVISWKQYKWIVQFWRPRMMEKRCFLETLDQPYAVGCLSKGIASFRKKCMTHSYFVDEEAKQEELGPPGRVFRNWHPEFTPDLFYYTTNEFPIRNYAMHCFGRGYFSIPVFDDDDDDNHKCVGVLEFLGFHYSDLLDIERELKAVELCSTHTDVHPRFLANEQTICCREEALTELHSALEVICNNIPQVQMANVWVPNGECVTSSNSNTSCMELALSTNNLWTFMPTDQVHWIHVQTRKGMVGMVLASENKSCFCQNLCEFSITDQPLSHFETSDRRDVCFAICLQSSQTGDLVYAVEFYLYQGPATYEYVRSFLNFLMPIMKQELNTFKMASGKELGEELVVEVIEFSDASKLGSFESEQTQDLPIKFKRVQYNQKEHQQMEECGVVVEHHLTQEQHTDTRSVDVEHQHTEERQTEECSDSGSESKRRKRGKRKNRVNFSIELLEPHFQKTEIDAAKVFNVSLSTIKRACRRLGIDRWPGPGEEKYKKNSTFYATETARKARNDTQTSTRNIQPLYTNTESSPHVIFEEEDAEKVIFKVKYEEDTIKFEFCLSLGLARLMEQVRTRLNLEKSAFKLKYLDEDGDEILLTNDADLQFCRKTQITSMHNTFIQLFAR